MNPEDLLKGLDDADELVQVASAIRNKFILSGWSSTGAESMTELLISAAISEVVAVGFTEDDAPGDF